MALAAENHRRLRALFCVALGVLLIRGTCMLSLQHKLDLDVDQYRQLAETLRQDHVYGRQGAEKVHPTAFRPPLYPLMLAGTSPDGTVGNWQVIIVHLLMSIASAWIMILLARACGAGRACWLAGLLVTIDPVLLYQSTQLMTETLATLLALLLLLAMVKSDGGSSGRWMLLAGAIAGLAILCRPTFLAFAGLAWLVIAARRHWKPLVAFSLASGAVLMPWVIRNAIVLEKPVITTTHGGYTLLLGNNPLFYEHLRSAPYGSTWNPNEFDNGWRKNHLSDDPGFDFWSAKPAPSKPSPPRGEVDDDRFAYQVAFHSMRAEPAAFAWSCLVRLGRLWSPLPHQVDPEESMSARLVRYASGAWYLVILGMATVGCWRKKSAWLSDPWIWGLLLCLAFSVVHLFYWSNIRMRAPLMPFVYLAALNCLSWPGSAKKDSQAPTLE